MNIVGQFAETVFVTVKELYRGLNPATLTGGIDVIVVRQPDGSFQCSPFHVRFGKLGVLRSKEKIVDIEINGESVDLHMKLGDNGEAFFVEENENKESQVPSHLCTSPIPLEDPEELEEIPEGSSVAGSGARRKKRRRKRMRSDTHLREEAGSSSDEREREKDRFIVDRLRSGASCHSELFSGLIFRSLTPDLIALLRSSVFPSRPSSPKSDSELMVKPQESSGPQMQWNWGGFPMPVIRCGRVGSVTVVRPQPRTQSLDLSSHTTLTSPISGGGNPHASTSTPGDLSKSCATRALESTLREEETPLTNGTEHLASKESTIAVEHIGAVSEPNEAQGPRSTEASDPQPQGEPGPASGGPVSEGDSGIDPCAEGGEEDGGPGGAEGSAGGSPTLKTEELASSSEASSKVEQQDKKKGKRNHHLGPTDIYLDDLTTLEPEVAALYFPKSESEGASPPGAEQGSCSGSQSPQSVGSGAMDSGTEYLSDSASYNMDISMSLCGQEGDTSQITKEKFTEHIVTYQDFASNPEIIEDPSLVICINSNYYNWAVAAPMVLCMTTFQKSLPKSTIERLVKDKMPKKSGRWWFSWRKRDMDRVDCICCLSRATLDDIDSDEVAGLGRKAMIPSSLSIETLNATQCITQMYRKSLRLTSKQIHLNLREGANKVVFSVTTQYQGTCRCEAAIYLWNWDDHVIISDIDGTITKSDALGHILPQFGKDWTHKGIAKLYHKIHQNGYKFLYCSARAIGMAAITKDYLQWVNDKGIVLPQGPVLLAPSSLFSALHREVIEKKPEVFKIACLSDIKDLFTAQRKPFYAAFGNRTNDAFAYKQVGVPDTRVFTVNPKGELIQERTKVSKSSYSHLSELVEHFFPMLSVGGNTSNALDCPEYSSFSYWKEPLPELDLDALL
uniref:phosphatidate phosphatase n=1 Tax=Cyclopterus lumpus TaxID=8103 RepID=A0A8C3A1F6_CYCLU